MEVILVPPCIYVNKLNNSSTCICLKTIPSYNYINEYPNSKFDKFATQHEEESDLNIDQTTSQNERKKKEA